MAARPEDCRLGADCLSQRPIVGEDRADIDRVVGIAWDFDEIGEDKRHRERKQDHDRHEKIPCLHVPSFELLRVYDPYTAVTSAADTPKRALRGHTNLVGTGHQPARFASAMNISLTSSSSVVSISCLAVVVPSTIGWSTGFQL